MIFVVYLIGFGTLTMYLILLFEKQQGKKMGKLLRETKNVQPLFLLRAAEHRLSALNVKLYGSMNGELNTVPNGRANISESARQLIAGQLAKLTSDYNSGSIRLKEYNNQLGGLLSMIADVKGMSFEQINN